MTHQVIVTKTLIKFNKSGISCAAPPAGMFYYISAPHNGRINTWCTMVLWKLKLLSAYFCLLWVEYFCQVFFYGSTTINLQQDTCEVGTHTTAGCLSVNIYTMTPCDYSSLYVKKQTTTTTTTKIQNMLN